MRRVNVTTETRKRGACPAKTKASCRTSGLSPGQEAKDTQSQQIWGSAHAKLGREEKVLWNRTTRTAASGDLKEGARLSHTRRTLGGPAPNSLVCSPRRPRRQVFRALFPACDCTLRIVRPSYAGLRPRNNGDRGLGVGTRSALEKQGPQSPSHSSGILPPLG